MQWCTQPNGVGVGRQRAEVVSEREVSVAERCTKERMLLGILKAVDFRDSSLSQEPRPGCRTRGERGDPVRIRCAVRGLMRNCSHHKLEYYSEGCNERQTTKGGNERKLLRLRLHRLRLVLRRRLHRLRLHRLRLHRLHRQRLLRPARLLRWCHLRDDVCCGGSDASRDGIYCCVRGARRSCYVYAFGDKLTSEWLLSFGGNGKCLSYSKLSNFYRHHTDTTPDAQNADHAPA